MLLFPKTVLVWDRKTKSYRENILQIWIKAIHSIGLAVFASVPGVVLYWLGFFTLIWRLLAVPIKQTSSQNRIPSAAESAELGAEIRQRLISLIEAVETQIGQVAIAVAEKEGVLMVHPKLTEEIRRRPDSTLLEGALSICFRPKNDFQRFAQTWQLNVNRLSGEHNTHEVLRDKATILTTYITYNLNISSEVYEGIGVSQPKLSYKQEVRVRLEEAACWFRVVGEIAAHTLGDERFPFMGYVSERLAHLLALEGAPPHLICKLMAARSAEYCKYKDWIPKEGQNGDGTLLWEAAKNVGRVTGISQHPSFLLCFSLCFMQRYKKAMILELLRCD